MAVHHAHASTHLTDLLAELGHNSFSPEDFQSWERVHEGVGKALEAVRKRLSDYPTLMTKLQPRLDELTELSRTIGEDDCNGVDMLAHLLFIVLGLIPRI